MVSQFCSPALATIPQFIMKTLKTYIHATITTVAAVAIFLLTRRSRSRRADHSPNMSPDTVSSLFPDRPIRPLPKRRLREKLSPEVADSISYPPSTHDAAPLFYFPPYSAKEGSVSSIESFTSLTVENGFHTDFDDADPRSVLSEGPARWAGPNDRGQTPRSTLVQRSPPEILIRGANQHPSSEAIRGADTQPPLSATSSVDGYDPFENTNNKKKRKIPSAGDHTLNGALGLNGDLGSLAVTSKSSGSDILNDRHSIYGGSGGHGQAGQGFSGSGRGRIALSRSGRSPLRTLADGNNAWAPRMPKAGIPQWSRPERPGSGIISNAIANAGRHPPQGQENVSLLEQHSSSSKSTPASSQFTFTCDSQVPGTFPWPSHPSKQSMGTQTMAGTAPGVQSSPHGQNPSDSPRAASGGSGNSRRRSRRRLERELVTAARHRRELAEDNNYQNPPKPGDVWICEFCEYEQIFGEPPRALVRDYELKDRRFRQEEADRKRLLEKAKAKSRKSKKSGKASSKGNQSAGNTPVPPQNEAGDGVGAPPMDAEPSRSTQSGEDDFDFEEDYMNPPGQPVPGDPARAGIGISDGDGGGTGNGGSSASYGAKT